MGIGNMMRCVVCGALVVSGSVHVEHVCQPATQMCQPLVRHQPDEPQRPTPSVTRQLVTVTSTSSATVTGSLAAIFTLPPKKTQMESGANAARFIFRG